MKYNWKRAIAGVLAVAMMTSMTAVTALAEEKAAAEETAAAETTDTAADGEETAAKREEPQEEIEITADQVKKYMQKRNSCDGITFYLRTEDYDETITDEDVVDLLDNIELAGIDDKTGDVVCTLEEEDDTDDFVIFLSEEGRWLVYTDPEYKKVTMVRKIVSLLDHEFLFLSMDGKTLELYNDDYDEVEQTYTKKGNAKEGKLYYESENGEAVLNETGTQLLYKCRFVTENDKLALYVDDDMGSLGLLDKESGKMWWSTPEGSGQDKLATNTVVDELQSSLTMVYGQPEARTTSNMRSRSDATLKVKDNSDGVTITYNFKKPGITIPVTYTLKEDYLEAKIVTADIVEEDNSNTGCLLTSLSLMGNFGAASSTDEGYFVIPDGSGALIRFNNGKTSAKSYAQTVYGSDITAVPEEEPATTEQVYLPMYGIVNSNDGMMVVCTDGDSNAQLNAAVSQQSRSTFNTCGFSFTLRDDDTYHMSGDMSSLTVFESGGIKTDVIALRYYPLTDTQDDGMDYVDVANAYRDYLMTEEGLEATPQTEPALYLDLYGGVEKKKSILGVPVTVKHDLTTFSQAKTIMQNLQSAGAKNLVVGYHNWTNDGITNKVDVDTKPSGKLGGRIDWKDLRNYAQANHVELYPTVDNKTFVNGNGYLTFRHTAVRISGSYARIYDYDLAYGTQSSVTDPLSLLSPDVFAEIYSDMAENYPDGKLTKFSLGSMTSTLYGDYGKKAVSRDSMMETMTDAYAKLTENMDMLAETANAYAIPYATAISNVPLQSSGFDVFDEDIPFYQLVLHGIKPYGTTAVNGSADAKQLILKAIACGSNLGYDMIGSETSELKDTALDTLYYAYYADWQDTAAQSHLFASDVLAGVQDQKITAYEQDGDKITTTYENGTEIVVDLKEATAEVDGKTYRMADYVEEGSWQSE